MYNLGIDIGGTFIKYALVDEAYKIIDKWKVETVKLETKDELYDYICNNIRNIDDIEVIGISAPGVIDEEANVKSYAAPNLRIMYGTNIVDEIQNRTNKKVAAINDANLSWYFLTPSDIPYFSINQLTVIARFILLQRSLYF